MRSSGCPVVTLAHWASVVLLGSNPTVCDGELFCNKPHSLSIIQNVLVLHVKPKQLYMKVWYCVTPNMSSSVLQQ